MQTSFTHTSSDGTASTSSAFEISAPPSDEEMILLDAMAAGIKESPQYKENLAHWIIRASVLMSPFNEQYPGLDPTQLPDSVFTESTDERTRRDEAMSFYKILRQNADDRCSLYSLVSSFHGVYAKSRLCVWEPIEPSIKCRGQELTLRLREFARRTGPTELSGLPIDSHLVQRCMSAVSKKDQGWGKLLNDEGCYYSLDAHHAVAKEFQLELLSQSTEPQQNSNSFCLQRLSLPRVFLDNTVETISFSLADPSVPGVPVCETADGLFTVFDGELPAFDSNTKKDLRAITIILLLNWPGHETAYIPFDILNHCTRQEFAQKICREIIVWATVLSHMPKLILAMEERWPICTPETDLENMWLTFARRLDGYTENAWIVELQLGN